VVDHPHVEPASATRHCAADLPEPDDAKRRAVHVMAGEERRVPRGPASLAHRAVAFGQPARGGEEQRECEVRRRLCEHAGRVTDGDAALARRVDVDVVVADRHRADDAQAGRRVDQSGVDVVGEQAEQPFRLGGGAQ
jgi:hypothetical protein